jgi:hypothetical protein
MKMFAQIALDIAFEDHERQQHLKESPGGFHLEKDGYSCRICHGSASGKNSWFDEHGLKCINCQQAINQQIIPLSVATDKESWYTHFELELAFNLTPPVLRRWEKKGLLISRTIGGNGKRTHLKLFMISDNKSMLPPKALVDSKPVIEVIDGKEWNSSRPWYQFVDPYQHLKGYKILDYLDFISVDGANPYSSR